MSFWGITFAEMKYSHDNTILIWSDDDNIKLLFKKLAKSLRLNLFDVGIETDIYAVPYFFAVIDGNKIKKETFLILKEVLIYENPKEFIILVYNNSNVKIPGSIKKYFKLADADLTEKYLRPLILNKHTAIKRHQKNKKSYDKIIFRTVYILRKLMQKNVILKIEDLCMEFNVSEKTIKRDIELLRSMGEDIEYNKSERGYYLKHSLINI